MEVRYASTLPNHMKFYLVFETTGDTIELETDRPDLLEYYMDFLAQHNINRFTLESSHQFVKKTTYLQQILHEFNNSVPGKLISFDNVQDPKNFMDQNILNKLHCEWVHSHHKKFSISDLKHHYPKELAHLFDSLSDDIQEVIFSGIVYKYQLQDIYSSINLVLHDIESTFDAMVFRANFCRHYNWLEIQNIFPKKYTSNSRANLSLWFNHYGRTLADKYRRFDHDLVYDDENTYQQLLGWVKLSLLPSETIAYSEEYLQWCQKIGREPGGDKLNLGNIIDLDKNLLEYRRLICQNIFYSSNSFSFSFSK